jgi:hypothetical protein
MFDRRMVLTHGARVAALMAGDKLSVSWVDSRGDKRTDVAVVV